MQDEHEESEDLEHLLDTMRERNRLLVELARAATVPGKEGLQQVVAHANILSENGRHMSFAINDQKLDLAVIANDTDVKTGIKGFDSEEPDFRVGYLKAFVLELAGLSAKGLNLRDLLSHIPVHSSSRLLEEDIHPLLMQYSAMPVYGYALQAASSPVTLDDMIGITEVMTGIKDKHTTQIINTQEGLGFEYRQKELWVPSREQRNDWFRENMALLRRFLLYVKDRGEILKAHEDFLAADILLVEQTIAEEGVTGYLGLRELTDKFVNVSKALDNIPKLNDDKARFVTAPEDTTIMLYPLHPTELAYELPEDYKPLVRVFTEGLPAESNIETLLTRLGELQSHMDACLVISLSQKDGTILRIESAQDIWRLLEIDRSSFRITGNADYSEQFRRGFMFALTLFYLGGVQQVYSREKECERRSILLSDASSLRVDMFDEVSLYGLLLMNVFSPLTRESKLHYLALLEKVNAGLRSDGPEFFKGFETAEAKMLVNYAGKMKIAGSSLGHHPLIQFYQSFVESDPEGNFFDKMNQYLLFARASVDAAQRNLGGYKGQTITIEQHRQACYDFDAIFQRMGELKK